MNHSFFFLDGQIMDDTTKMRVLMIYYEYWGKEEIRTRKTVCGLHSTLKIIEDHIQNYDDYFYYFCHDIYFLWTEFTDMFLKDCGGCFDAVRDGFYYDEQDLLLNRKMRLEEHMSGTSDANHLLYHDEFRYNNILSVDAILALV